VIKWSVYYKDHLWAYRLRAMARTVDAERMGMSVRGALF